MCDLLLGNDLLLGEDLHSEDTFRVLFPHLEHLAKGPAADELEEFKVPGCECPLRLRISDVRGGENDKAWTGVGMTNLVLFKGDLHPHLACDHLVSVCLEPREGSRVKGCSDGQG